MLKKSFLLSSASALCLAVGSKSFANAIFASLIVGGAAVSSAWAGETISYDDTAGSAVLQDNPEFEDEGVTSLYVGTPTSPSVSDNIVIVDYTGNKTAPDWVYGGLILDPTVAGTTSENNKVFIKNGTINKQVVGSYSVSLDVSIAKANNNSVIISGGTLNSDVIAAQGMGVMENNNNSVEMSGGSVYGAIQAVNLAAQLYDATAIGNRVKISGGAADYDVAGVYLVSLGSASRKMSISDTYVEISDGSIKGNVAAATMDITGDASGPAAEGVVSNNLVKISGGSIGGSVKGASVEYGEYSNVIMSHNDVEISGGTIGGDVYGGSIVNSQDNGDWSVTDNTVTLIGDQITIGKTVGGVTTYGSIYGGRNVDDGGNDVFDFDKVMKGNTLNLVGYRGTVSGIHNFENYNWTLPGDVVNGDTIIKIADGGTAVDLTNTKHTIVDMQVSDNRLHSGDKITLISKSQGAWTAQGYKIKQGQFIVYDATLAQQTNGSDQSFVLTIDHADGVDDAAGKLNPQSKSYSEGRAAALGFLNQGNDLIANAGISKIRTMVLANQKDATRPALIPFVIANGSSQNYKTGSHVDVRGFNTAMGLATGFTFASGHKATLGAFFEYGRGTYDTFNSFADYASVHGDGDTNYKGGGIFGRIEFAGTGLGRVSQFAPDQADGLYAEASLRIGRASSKFDVGRNANVLGEFTGVYRGAYDSKSTYYGGHVAGGYVFNFDDKQSLDVYARYLWTHMESDTVAFANEKLHFGNANSSRIQLGGRYAYAYSDQFQPYIGAAYEYEFEGDIKAKAYEFNLDRPSLKGSTGIFEAGFSFQPLATNKAFNIDVNGQAYVGQRQGGGGGIKLKYQF